MYLIKGIIFDFNRTLYDPEKGRLFDGVIPLLNFLKAEGLKLGLISFGGEEKSRLIESLGLTEALDWEKVVAEKRPDDFREFPLRFGLKEEEVLVVGDLLDEEIALGVSLGMQTAWIGNSHSRRDLGIQPNFVIEEIGELRSVLTKLRKK